MAQVKKDSKKQSAEAELVVETAAVEAPVEVADSGSVEQPVTPETNVTEAAEAAAVEEQAVIEEKRGTADTAKAGKRSAKAQREAEEHLAKEARKTSGEIETTKPKQPLKPARSRLERRGKKFRASAQQIDASKAYSLKEAVELAKKTSTVAFDATVELHVRLGVDPRHADQNIRDNVVLPAGTGKTVRVAVFDDAKVAGADMQGVETLTKLLDKGQLDFDVLIATPAQMPKLGKYARVLGPRGLMPNPKSGTVTTDLAKGVNEAKAGRVEYRVDSTGIVHLGVGKVSFTPEQLIDNIQAIFTSIKNSKPASIKGNYVKAIYVTTSMGPSIAVETTALN